MARAFYAALGIVLIVAGCGLSANVFRMTERVVNAFRPAVEDVPARVSRWRALGFSYVVAGVLLLVIALLSR